MNLSDNTLGILKNFAGINNSILVKEGNQLRTISVMKNILAEAQIPEDFPRQFGIYDLNQFLNGLSLHTDPNLDLLKSHILLSVKVEERFKYFFCWSTGYLFAPPEKEIYSSYRGCLFFSLESVTLEKLLKAAAVYQLPDLSAVSENGSIKLIVHDKKNDTSNEFAIIVGETDSIFSFNFKIENIKIIPGAYDVVISSKLLSRFVNNNLNLTYYIALEPDSTFE